MDPRLSGKIVLIVFSGVCCLLWTCFGLAAAPEAAGRPKAAGSPLKGLDPFYKQYVEVEGMLILGSEKVSPYALREVAYLARKMLANRPTST